MAQASVLVRFLRWWSDELRSCIPGFVRRLFLPSRPRLVCVVSDEAITICSERGRQRARVLDHIERADDVAAALRKAFSKYRSRRSRSTLGLRIPLGWCLERQLELPKAARANAANILLSDLERSTPLGGGRSYQGAFVDVAPESDRIIARQVVVLKERVDPLLALINDAGGTCDFIDVHDQTTGETLPVNLLATTDESKLKNSHMRWALATGTAAVIATGLIANSILSRQEVALTRLQQATAEVKPQALAVRQQLDQLSNARSRQDKLLRRKLSPSAPAIWAELTRTVPQSAWIESLRIERSSVEIAGYAVSAAELVGVLEKSPLFRDAALSSPVMRDDRVGAEHFGIRLALEGVPDTDGSLP